MNLHGESGNGEKDDKWHLPAKVETDAGGNPFDNVASVAGGFHFDVALKKDGTVWVWGLSGSENSEYNSAGILGNGDKSSQSVTRPTRVPFPDGISITKVSPSSTTMLALDSTGGVWSWGGGENYDRGTDKGNGASPVKLSKLPVIKAIAAGDICSFALDTDGNLWGWGRDNSFLCLGNGKDNFQVVPTPIKLSFPDLNNRITDVEVSLLSVHVIRDDKTLWGWGSSAMGEVGDGTINDWAHTKTPYAWDWNRDEKLVMAPIQVLDRVETVYASPQAPYLYAVKTDGTIWSWGRNKTGVLGNGIVPPPNEAGIHPNSWDVAKPTQVTPF
jgi:alpha-tubulin suppressor-like RCC1 family protein